MTGTRVLTALVLIPIVIGLVLFTPTWIVAVALALITILALWEYFALGDAIGHRAYRLWTIACALILIYGSYLEALTDSSMHANRIRLSRMFWPFPGDQPYPGHVFFLFLMGLVVLTLWTKRPLVEALPSAGISSSALLLVAFPLSYAVRLHGGIGPDGPRLLLFALAITWAADTTAYFVGRAIGKHPLAPHISPKKTWEGSIGSLIGSLLIAYIFHWWLTIPLAHLYAMATVGNIAGQMGDLVESACKRSAGVKDSGGLLPGHGGVLDRIDALILAIPVIWYYLVLVNPRY
jgi:phosphatidate cytidylyltransferase